MINGGHLVIGKLNQCRHSVELHALSFWKKKCLLLRLCAEFDLFFGHVGCLVTSRRLKLTVIYGILQHIFR